MNTIIFDRLTEKMIEMIFQYADQWEKNGMSEKDIIKNISTGVLLTEVQRSVENSKQF